MLFYQFPFSSQSQPLSWTHTHFHENSSQAPLLLLLSDDLYVPNLNANPEKNSLPQWFIRHSQK